MKGLDDTAWIFYTSISELIDESCIFGERSKDQEFWNKSNDLITNQAGLRMSYAMLRNRWDDTRKKAAAKAALDGDKILSDLIRQFQFRDIRPKAASEIDDIGHASRLLGHSSQEMTRKVYRRVGEIVSPTK